MSTIRFWILSYYTLRVLLIHRVDKRIGKQDFNFIISKLGYALTNARTRTHTHNHIRTHTHTYTYAYAYAYAYTYTYTHTQTHTHTHRHEPKTSNEFPFSTTKYLL